MIHRLVYRSRADGVLPEVALENIFRASVPNNARMNITGALGYSEQTYIQLLEGPSSSLDVLVGTLQADPRHRDMEILLREPAARRLLSGWSMARINLTRLAPRVQTLLRTDDGLGLIALMATLAHEGVAT